jgi:hypothetical protein
MRCMLVNVGPSSYGSNQELEHDGPREGLDPFRDVSVKGRRTSAVGTAANRGGHHQNTNALHPCKASCNLFKEYILPIAAICCLCFKFTIRHPHARPIAFCLSRLTTAYARAIFFLVPLPLLAPPWLGLGSLGFGVQGAPTRSWAPDCRGKVLGGGGPVVAAGYGRDDKAAGAAGRGPWRTTGGLWRQWGSAGAVGSTGARRMGMRAAGAAGEPPPRRMAT